MRVAKVAQQPLVMWPVVFYSTVQTGIIYFVVFNSFPILRGLVYPPPLKTMNKRCALLVKPC